MKIRYFNKARGFVDYFLHAEEFCPRSVFDATMTGRCGIIVRGQRDIVAALADGPGRADEGDAGRRRLQASSTRPNGVPHLKIQILTVADLFAGRTINRPPDSGATFKKAPKATDAVQERLKEAD